MNVDKLEKNHDQVGQTSALDLHVQINVGEVLETVVPLVTL